MAQLFLRRTSIGGPGPMFRYYYYNTIGHSIDSFDGPAMPKTQFYTFYGAFNIPRNESFWTGETWNGVPRPNGYELDDYCGGVSLTDRILITYNGATALHPNETNLIQDITPDWPSCGFIPNDLHIISIVQEDGDPGEVIATINAASSHGGLEYSLDGITYQISNQFTITVAGTYIAYVRDAGGFVVSESFVVNISTYELRYFGDYSNFKNEYVEVKIYQKDYAGEPEDVVLGGNPISIKWNQEGDEKYKPIKGSECVVSLIAETDFQFLDMFTGEDKKYRLDVIKTINLNNEFTNDLSSWSQTGGAAEWLWVSGKASVVKGPNFGTNSLYQSVDLRNAIPYTVSLDITSSGGNWNLSIQAFNATPGDGETIKFFGTDQTELSYTYTAEFTLYDNYEKFNVYFSLGGAESQTITVDNLRVYYTLWTGFIAPEAYSEPYLAPPYPVSATFLDGLGLLKRRDFLTPTDQVLNSIKSQMEILKICLLETGLQLPILEGVNIYETSMDQDPEDSPLIQSYINAGIYTEGDKTQNCYDALESILVGYGARIFQEDGIWKIINIDDLGGDYIARKYSPFGIYLDYYTINPDLTLATNVACFTGSSQRLEISPGYKEAEAEIQIKQVGNIISNGGFDIEGEDGVIFKDWDDDFGILSKGVTKDKSDKQVLVARVTGDGGVSWDQFVLAKYINIPNISSTTKMLFKVRFKICSTTTSLIDIRAKFKVSIDTQYLTNTGDWTTTETFITPTGIVNEYKEFEVESEFLMSGGVFKFEVYQSKAFDAGDVDYTDFEYVEASFIEDNIKIPEKKTVKLINDGLYTFKPEVKKILFADFPEYSSAGLILKNAIYLNEEGSEVSATWNRRGVDEERELIELLIDRILNNSNSPTQIIKGSIFGKLRFSNIVIDPNNSSRRFMINGIQYKERDCMYTVELVELVSLTEESLYILCEDGEKLSDETIENLLREG